MESIKLFEKGKMTCPLCQKTFHESEYLTTVIEDEKTRWFANLITHYRHTHISSWNKCWGYGGRRYRNGWFGSYDDEKQKVNERAKRQIIRKAKETLKSYGITVGTIKGLSQNSAETIKLAEKFLDVV